MTEDRDQRSEVREGRGRKSEGSLRPGFRLGEPYSSERGAYAPVGDQTSEREQVSERTDDKRQAR